MSDQAKGLTLAIVGILVLTPDTLLIRLIAVDEWRFLAWRGGLMAIGLLVVLLLRYGLGLPARIWAIGWPGLLVALAFATTTVLFQFAVQHTSVANVLVILSTAPLFAAVIGIVLLREAVSLPTWGAIAFCLLGVSMIFVNRIAHGGLFGDLCAIGAAAAIGLHFTLVRLAKEVDMSPALVVAAVMISLTGLAAAPTLYLDPRQAGLMLILGLVVLPVSFILLTLAPRLITAPEVSLVTLLETVLGPLWVWLVIHEEPPVETLAGGAVILATPAIHSLIGLRRARPAAAV